MRATVTHTTPGTGRTIHDSPGASGRPADGPEGTRDDPEDAENGSEGISTPPARGG
ncbi:hypothetical protein GCM10014719_36660 [Planomonospora parontospora subsp. antibiotica]|nr:hypothetical protein GCM10014719_36660 [Planomonospora parontospora subsp. antibiotica]GII16886.1 hypothetical protein Ppa05_36120 [Planomonospora parontospora subsp. antibiotica]